MILGREPGLGLWDVNGKAKLAWKLRQGAVASQSGPRRSGHAPVKAYWLYGEPAREPLHRR